MHLITDDMDLNEPLPVYTGESHVVPAIQSEPRLQLAAAPSLPMSDMQYRDGPSTKPFLPKKAPRTKKSQDPVTMNPQYDTLLPPLLDKFKNLNINKPKGTKRDVRPAVNPGTKPKFKRQRVKIDRTPLGEINRNTNVPAPTPKVPTKAVLERFKKMKGLAARPGSLHEGQQAKRALKMYKKTYNLS